MALSTALAILALRALGTAETELDRPLAALAERVCSGDAAAAVPFYSTERIAWSTRSPWELLHAYSTGGAAQLVRVDGVEHAVTFYRDPEGLVVFALAVSALLPPVRSAPFTPSSGSPVATAPHARYGCASAVEYITQHALPPYLAPQGVAR
mgnify:CR=1 FL=1